MRNSERLAEIMSFNNKRAIEFNAFMQREFAHQQQAGESIYDTAERLLIHYQQLSALQQDKLLELSTLWKIATIAGQLAEMEMRLNTIRNNLSEVITALTAICQQYGLNIVEFTKR